MNPCKYYLCRNDKNTKQRHIETAHKMDSCSVQFATIDQFEAKEALHLYEVACKNRVAKNADPSAVDQFANSCSPLDGGSKTTAESPFEDDSDELVNECKIIENKQDEVANNSTIEVKLDTVIGMLENLSTKVGQTKQSFPEMSVVVKELSMDKDTHVEWNSVENIIDLTEKVQAIRFFASEDNKKGCVRCQTCFDSLCMRDGNISKLKQKSFISNTDGYATDNHIRK